MVLEHAYEVLSRPDLILAGYKYVLLQQKVTSSGTTSVRIYVCVFLCMRQISINASISADLHEICNLSLWDHNRLFPNISPLHTYNCAK